LPESANRGLEPVRCTGSLPVVSSECSSSAAHETGQTPSERNDAVFVTTRWSVVLSAREEDTARSAEALEMLCRAYWYPLYAFVRRQGHSPPDAQDLTQEFFARLLVKKYLNAADRGKGRFRSFLLMALKRFLANEWDKARARKRGGAQQALSLDTTLAEQRYMGEADARLSADRIYDRRWALTMLDQTMARLRREYESQGKKAEFEQLKRCLTAERGEISYAETATALNLSEGTARVVVHRIRKRFRELFREEIAQTVATPKEIDDEVRHLMRALAG